MQGKKVCFSNIMAKKQEFLAADSFLFWNADDVRPIRDRLNGFVCVLPDPSCAHGGHRKLLKAPAPSWGHCNTSALDVDAESFSCCIFIFGSGNDLRYFTRIQIQVWVWLDLWQVKRQARRAEQSRASADFYTAAPTRNRVGWRNKCTLLDMRVWFGV